MPDHNNPYNLSTKDRSDLEHIRGLLPANDPRRSKIDTVLGVFSQHQSQFQHQISARPSAMTPAGIRERLYTARDWAINQLPGVGGFAGGLIGAGAGGGVASIGTAALGAAAGGAGGEDIRQSLNEYLHPEDKKMGGTESALRMAGAGGSQALQELGGRVSGRLVGHGLEAFGSRVIPEHAFERYPFLKNVFAIGEPKAAQHLTAAAAEKGTRNSSEAFGKIVNTLDDLQEEIGHLPKKEQTISGFLKAVNSRKNAINLESGAAMMPIAGEKTVPTGVANNIKGLIRSYMTDSAEGRAQRKYIIKRAAEFEKPRTYRSLDELRTDLSSQLSKHKAKGSVAKYTAEKGDLDLAIDNAILNGLRDTVYPQMDRAAGKPAGYFKSLKARQSSLMSLQEILEQRVKDLSAKEAVEEVSPRFGSENLSVSAHAGSLPRVGAYGIRQAISPTRSMAQASKHVSKAFRPTVNSLPYQVLFSGGIRAVAVPQGPKTQNLQRMADEQRNGANTQ